MSDDIEVRHGTVIIGGCYECGGVECSPSEARALAAQIVDAAARAEANIAAIEAACADGHDWGSAFNMWANWTDQIKVSVQHCRRDGCDGRQELPGWTEFAGQLHFDPIGGRQISCYGPGCDNCVNEKFGKALRTMLIGAYDRLSADLDAAVIRDKEA